MNFCYQIFPNGLVRCKLFSYDLHQNKEKNYVFSTFSQKEAIVFSTPDESELPFSVNPELFDEEKKKRNRERARRRTIQRVYDLSLSFSPSWFGTFTVSPSVVEDRFSYDQCSSQLIKLLNSLRHKANCVQYLVVPEKHKSGAWHFHIVLGECALLPVEGEGQLERMFERAISPSGRKLCDRKGRKLYNLKDCKLGFTSFSKVDNPQHASAYIVKYLTKQDVIPEGKKAYWATRNIKAPEKQYLSVPPSPEFIEAFKDASDYEFSKKVLPIDGEYHFFEFTDPETLQALLSFVQDQQKISEYLGKMPIETALQKDYNKDRKQGNGP